MKYTKENTVENNSFSDPSKKYSLSVDEQITATNNVLGKNGKYARELEGMRNVDLDPVASEMFKNALVKLEYVNVATNKEFKIEKDSIDNEIAGMKSGDNKEWDISYKDGNGNNIQSIIGVEKDGGENKYYFVDSATGNKMETNEDKFNEKLNTSVRNRVKDEHGIGNELYSMTAADGTKFVITEKEVDKAAQENVQGGFKGINMYVVKPDGEKTQMTKQDVSQMVQDNGISVSDVARGTTQKIDLQKALQEAEKRAKEFMHNREEEMGLSTSTQA